MKVNNLVGNDGIHFYIGECNKVSREARLCLSFIALHKIIKILLGCNDVYNSLNVGVSQALLL